MLINKKTKCLKKKQICNFREHNVEAKEEELHKKFAKKAAKRKAAKKQAALKQKWELIIQIIHIMNCWMKSTLILSVQK